MVSQIWRSAISARSVLGEWQAVRPGLAVAATLDVDQGFETLHGFECDRLDHVVAIAAAPLAHQVYDIDRLEELAAGMDEAASLEYRAGIGPFSIEDDITIIGISRQDAGRR